MPEPSYELVNQKTVNRSCSNIQISDKQREGARNWLNLLKSGQLFQEKKNYLKFAGYVLEDILGYNLRTDINFEEGNVEFSVQGMLKTVGFEAKGTSQDLLSSQNRNKSEHRTPVRQTWDYIGQNKFDYGIATNYQEFILLDKNEGYSRYHKFDFTSVENNEEKLKEFIGIFSKDRLIDTNFVTDLFLQSIVEEKELTDRFYRIFHETRIMLIGEFVSEGKISQSDAIHFAQLFLNRIIFVFFAEDRGYLSERLFANTIHASLDPSFVYETSRNVFDHINTLFARLDKGSNYPPEIFGFNGGLFKEKIPYHIFFNDIRDSSFFAQIDRSMKRIASNLNEISKQVLNKFKGSVNPIISNLLEMASFDFTSDINVNILGHIFEQSVTDLEILQGKRDVSRRKKEGIYYTPEYVTDYICRNTIIPYLSKTGEAILPEDLIREYKDELPLLELKIKQIKIIDPACGSGAFLIKAVEILLEIYNEIQEYKLNTGAYATMWKMKRRSEPKEYLSLDVWSEQEEIRRIIENNIFGLDINEESVDIARLSLFIRITANDKKLMDLSSNIKLGNSIVSDPKIDSRGIDWPIVFKNKFDIVIGNPPYIPLEDMDDAEKTFFQSNYKGIFRKYDTSVLFVEKTLDILSDDGVLGFIIPLTWQTGDNYFIFRKLLFKEHEFFPSNLINLPFDVFPDAYVDTGIAIFRRHHSEPQYFGFQYDKNEKLTTINPSFEVIKHDRILNDEDLKVFPDNLTYDILEKVKGDTEPLGNITRSCQGIVTSKHQISDSQKSSDYHRFLLKGEGNRYRFIPESIGFIDLTHNASLSHYYVEPKIMVRRIVNRQNRLMAFYENTGLITNKDYNPFILESTKYDIFYILALLNSKLFSFLYTKKSSIAQKDDFRQTTLNEIRKLPVKINDEEGQKLLSTNAKILSTFTQSYYEIINKMIRRIEGNFKIKVNDTLKNIGILTFEEFRLKLEEQLNRKLTLKEQDDWEAYFVENSKELKILRDQIKNLERDIDTQIYLLYDMSKSERIIIEKSILERPF